MHSDLTFENVLWDPAQRRVTAILDFEWARGGPADLDLDVLLRCVAYPKLHVAADYEHLTKHEDYAEVPWWLSEAYPELFSFPRQLDRVRIYCDRVGRARAAPLPAQLRARRAPPRPPVRRLVRTINGTSYLDTMDQHVHRPEPRWHPATARGQVGRPAP